MGGGPVPRTTLRSNGACAALPAPQSVIEGGIDEIAEKCAVIVALPRCLDEHQREHLLYRIDPEGGAGQAAPEVLADRTGHVRDAGVKPYRKAESETVTREQQVRRPGNRPEVIRSHEFNGLAAQQPTTVESPAVEQHLQKARVIARRRHQAAAA